MHKNFFLFSLILCLFCFCTGLRAKVNYTELMLQGNFDAILKNFQQEDNLRNLFEDEAIIFIHSLVTEGKIEDSKIFTDHYFKKYPKSSELLALKQQIDLFALDFDQDIFTDNQKLHIKMMQLNYPALNAEQKEELLHQILKLRNEFYLGSKYDYAFSLDNSDFFADIEKEALSEINLKQKILFPKTQDFYELAFAYKALAVIQIHKENLDQAKRFIKMAQSYIFKMRSICLVEDLTIYNQIMKTEKQSTRFTSLYPQYLIQLREEFSSFLI